MKRKILVLVIPLFLCIILFGVSILFKTESSAVSKILPEKSQNVVVIDAGHGGFDGGASTLDGFPEKDINLKISLYLKDYLELFGFKTVLTRCNDESLEDKGLKSIRSKKASDIHNRMDIMKDVNNCVFVSIHQNFFTEEKYYGMQVFYSKNFSEDSSALAQCIQNSGKELLNKSNQRLIKECGSSVYLIYNAVKPAVLVECGFLSNKNEAELLKTDSYQKKTAMAIALGINEYYKNKD